ncbi:hypothetical protein FNF27_06726 [Cafeteria roenbergensis]|uniref:Oxidoreductase n=1 Tax=Cafeteria roenbergensis TaxID=33653 RepID=A0A5A8DZI9_CAFRO|nr:hypothetical protein FNF27_06726 [Cafeteria roenbergensis]
MDSSDDEGPSMFSVSVPDPAEDEEMVAAQAACILSADDVATATRVLRTLADTSAMSEDDAGSVALRDLRQALVSAHTRLKKRFFGGTSVGVHATRTMLKRRMRAEEQRQKMLDRRFVDNTGLRRSRIQKMAELEGEHGGAVPMLLDGVTDRAGDDDEVAASSLSMALEDAAPAAEGVLTTAAAASATAETGAGAGAVAGGAEGAAFVTAAEADLEDLAARRALVGQESGAVHALKAMDAVAEAAARAAEQALPETATEEEREAARIQAVLAAASTAGAGESERVLHSPRACYRCRARFVRLHHFYASMCPACADICWAKRRQTTDLTGRIGIVTGARVKIGYHAAMRLLRCGADVIVVTRFPTDCARRYANEKTASAFAGRLHVYGIDMRSTPLLELWCAWLYRRYSHLDMIVNNACQTIRRPPAYYAHLLDAELIAHKAAGASLPASQRRMLRPYFDFLHWAQIAAAGDLGAADAAWERVTERRRRRREAAAESPSAFLAGAAVAPGLIGFAEADEGLPAGDEWSDGDGWGAFSAGATGSKAKAAIEGGAAAAAPPAAAAASPAAAAAAPSAAGDAAAEGSASTGHPSAPMEGIVSAAPSSGVPIVPAPMLSQMSAAPEDAITDMRLFPRGATDTNEQQVDLRRTNSWMLRMHEVSSTEAAEAFTINALAPFVMTGKLRGLMMRPPPEGNPTYGQGCSPVLDALGRRSAAWKRDVSGDDSSALAAARAALDSGKAGGEMDYSTWEVRPDRFVVQVSAMEGKFNRRKQPTHPHTNAAKAALNMMVKTSAKDYAKDRIFMNAVDTGWINPEQPVELAKEIAAANHFQTPIDEIDAAARILDPILAPVETRRLGRALGPDNMPPWGVFLKEFAETEW